MGSILSDLEAHKIVLLYVTSGLHGVEPRTLRGIVIRSFTKRSAIVSVAILSLVAASCGRSDSKTATPTAASTTAAVTTTAPSPADSSTTAASTASTTAAPSLGDYGDLKDVCGKGDAKGATDQGVTDTEIVLGAGADPGNTILPGLDQGIFDAAQAFVGWCNNAGGILGRKLVLKLHDAKLFELAKVMTEACETDFMLVGVGYGLDATGVEARTGCKLPQIATFTVSSKAGRAEGSIEAITNSDSESHLSGVYRILKEVDPTVLPFLGTLNNVDPSLNPSGNKDKTAAEMLGYKTVYYGEFARGVDNWRPFAEAIKEKGVQVFTILNSVEQTIALMKAMDDVGYFPKYFVVNGNDYSNKLLAEVGPLLSKTTFLINGGATPFEQADKNPAIKLYLDNLKAYANGAKAESLGVNTTSAYLLWAVAAKACGSDLTRDCVMKNARAAKEWTAGGMHTPQTPGSTAGHNSECFFTLLATPAGFEVSEKFTKPNKGAFNCDPANAVKIPGFPLP